MAGVWLSRVGGVKVEHHKPAYVANVPVIKGDPLQAVLHTTEGTWGVCHSIFMQHFCPTFMLGRDNSGKLRIAQYAGIGIMAYALENTSAKPETNRAVMAQVELVAKSQHSRDPLFYGENGHTHPMNDTERKLLCALMDNVKKAAGVPLKHGGDRTRSLSRFLNNPGWFGHGEVPDQPSGHWDPGLFDYDKTFAFADAPEPSPDPQPDFAWEFRVAGETVLRKRHFRQVAAELGRHPRKYRRMIMASKADGGGIRRVAV